MDSQIKPICFVSRYQEAKQHRQGTAGGTAEQTTRRCFLVHKVPGPTCSTGVSWPWPQQPHPPVPPTLGAAGSGSPVRDEGGKGRVLGSDAPGQGGAQAVVPQSLHGHDLTDAAHWGEHGKRGQQLLSVGSAGPLQNRQTENALPCSCICLCSQILSTLRAFCSVLSGMRSMCSSRYTRPYSGQWSK